MSKNIILLTIDALRADHVSHLGYERETTPFLDQLAEDAIVFENAYSASSHTREAVPALLTGQHPTEAISDGYTRGAKTLPLLLPDEYATAAFHSNPYVSRAYGYDEGFDTFYDDLRLGQNKLLALIQRALDKFVFNRGEYHARAEEINNRALSWLSSQPDTQPFFLWNHYMDVHGPYNPPKEFSEWSSSVTNPKAQRLYDKLSGDGSPTDEEVKLSKDLYDGEIRYVDAQIGQFIDALETRNLLGESLIIITSDHGDLFGEYGRYAHPRYVYPELTRVPMMISGSGVSKSPISAPVSTLDVVPTALEVAGSQSPDYPGQSLLRGEQFDRDRRVFSSAAGEGAEDEFRRYAVQTKNRGLRFTRNQTTGDITEETYYELPRGDVIDSGDTTDYQALRTVLNEHSDRRLTQMSTADDEETPPANADIEERLEALGYK